MRETAANHRVMSAAAVPTLCVFTVLALGLNASLNAQTAVYRYVDKNGDVTFSDKRKAGGDAIEVAPIQTYAPPARKPATPPAQVRGVTQSDPQKLLRAANYTRFEIVSPSTNEVLRSNAGNVAVGVRIEPELAPGNTIQFVVDGKSFGGASRNTVKTLSNVDRGTHTLSARVLNETGKTLATTPAMTFHLFRASIARRGKR